LKRKINPLLKCFEPTVDCIADLFGPNCEVVLHDISDLGYSIIKIRNGHVTGRKVGDSMTDAGLEMVKEKDKGILVVGNYNSRTKSGKLLKSNAINIRNPKGKLVGIICINVDVSEHVELEQKIHKFYKVEDKRKGKFIEEHFEGNIWSRAQEIIDETIKEKGVPIHNLTRKERLEILNKLDKKALFLIKGTLLQVSKSLGVSAPAIYKYLEEIRFQSKEKADPTK